MIVRKGTTRLVVLAGRYAFKFPRPTSWQLFLRGLLANMQEAEFSGVWEELCPVRFSIPGGFLTVMDRAEELQTVELESLPAEVVSMAETKPNNYGLLNGKLVAIDYG